MTTTYTIDVFSNLDGFGTATGDWGGYWGKQGPELLARRLELYDEPQRMALGANTYRAFAAMLDASAEYPDVQDAWVTRMTGLPMTVITKRLRAPLPSLPHADLARGDAVEIVARMKAESDVPLRSHGSL